jgi:broad specificity phosphatase PhoE
VTTTFYLIRHGAHALLNRTLAGRTVDVPLDERGQRQAAALAQRMARQDIATVKSSPRYRTMQTARPIAERIGLNVEAVDSLDEVDCGTWGGRTFDDLRDDADWRLWNEKRSTARPPGGESAAEVQQRVVAYVESLGLLYPERRIVLVSHSDVLRAAILHYLDMPLDAYNRIEIAPGAISTMVVGDWGGKLLSLNETVPT